MNKLVLLSWPILLLFNKSIEAQVARPKLVVGIVIDQMRWDFLQRFNARFATDGFKRLMNGGFNCQNAQINYLPTFTAPGHACVYTGSVPALHGIAANDWIENATGKPMYCTEDKTVQSVGGTGKSGQMSPRNLWATTVTDELRLATNKAARCFGVSIKDRGAILPAGHMANAAYWYDDENGKFISSTYYMQHLPAWVVDFNGRKIVDSLLANPWQTLYPINSYQESTPDNTRYEGIDKGATQAVFPHNYTNRNKDIRYSPGGNTLVRMMAEKLLLEENLGRSQSTDFLAVSFSSTDYIGHKYGPNAIEVEDTYLRMDAEIALLLKTLDSQVGFGNYTVMLTADHGAAHNSLFLKDQKVPAGNMDIIKVYKNLNNFLAKDYLDSNVVLSLFNDQVSLNERLIKERNIDRNLLKQRCKHFLLKVDGVAQVVDMENATISAAVAPLGKMIANGYNVQRSGCLQIIQKPGWYSGYAATGTTHGSWNPYDTHIPLIFYGWGVKSGETWRRVNMTDIAPTLSAILKIQEPNANIGEPIIEVLKK